MKIIERGYTPGGVKVLLEDWSGHNTPEYPNLHGLVIAAFPVAKNTNRYRWIMSGDSFRLQISMNTYRGYSNEQVAADYAALIAGEKTLEDLANHFWNGDKDKWYLGMDVEYKGW